jgi:hypothetical protein
MFASAFPAPHSAACRYQAGTLGHKSRDTLCVPCVACLASPPAPPMPNGPNLHPSIVKDRGQNQIRARHPQSPQLLIPLPHSTLSSPSLRPLWFLSSPLLPWLRNTPSRSTTRSLLVDVGSQLSSQITSLRLSGTVERLFNHTVCLPSPAREPSFSSVHAICTAMQSNLDSQTSRDCVPA